MRDDGLHLKKSAFALQHHVDMGDRPMLPDDPTELDIIRALTLKQKVKLLKKLRKINKKEKKEKKSKKKSSSKKKCKSSRREEWVEK